MIITLLYTIISLLSNPTVQSNPEMLSAVNNIYAEAIQLINKQMTQEPLPLINGDIVSTTTQINNSQVTPISIGSAPDNNIVQVQKSCNLSVTRIGQNEVELDWSSIGLDGIKGQIYGSNGQDGGQITYIKIDDVQSQGKMKNIQYGVGYFKLTFGDTVCYKNI